MNITKINLYLNESQSNEDELRAYAVVVIDNAIKIRDIKIIETDKLFVAMPSKKLKSGEYQDIVHPVNQEARDQLEGIILAEYHRLINA